MAFARSGLQRTLVTPLQEILNSNDPKAFKRYGVLETAVVEALVDGELKDVPIEICKFYIGDTLVSMYRHPELFIDQDVLAWEGQYNWIKRGGSINIDYLETNPLYHLAAGIYEAYYERFSQQLQKQVRK